jgi:3-dehydroquinate synthase
VGGKTAVNLARGKNLAGSFHQPALVLADTETLATLPDAELRSGLGEVVKTALVGDAELLELLERDAERLRARDIDLYGEIVARCVRVKAGIVARDERETGARKVLNLGHTFAHAIELTAGYGRIPHGVAVGVGIALALRASERTGLARPGVTDRIARLLPRLGLGSSLAALREEYGHELPAAELRAGLRHDKKGTAGRPAFVLVRDVGAAEVDRALDPALLRELLA